MPTQVITPNLTYSMPPDAGLPIGTNNTKWVAVELHYNNPELVKGIQDRAGIRIYYTDKLRRFDVGVLTVSQPDLLLPPGRPYFPVNVSVCPSACTKRCVGAWLLG
jgi:dopamine beta-monooxygenase